MADGCYSICDEEIIRNLVTAWDPEWEDKLNALLLSLYVEDNKMVKWCPNFPNCENAIRVKNNDEFCEVECACGMQLCFKCLSEAHSPCPCLMWARWISNHEEITYALFCYYSMYKSHRNSLKSEATHLKKKLSGKTLPSWVVYGLFRLTRSRKILMYSYPFGYFMFGENEDESIKGDLFEELQHQFETSIARLSLLLENLLRSSEREVMQTRGMVVNLSRVTDQLCRKMYDSIDDLLCPPQVIAPYRSNGVEKASEYMKTGSDDCMIEDGICCSPKTEIEEMMGDGWINCRTNWFK